MIEEWKPFPGLETLGSISNLGRVKSVHGVILKPRAAANGYLYIVIMQRGNGIKKTIRPHRLVALAFCEGYQEGYTVNHIDGDKTNNAASNLEWVSHRDNIRHAIKIGLRPPNYPRPKIPHEDRKMLIEMRKNGVKVKDLAVRYGVSNSSMGHFLGGRYLKPTLQLTVGA
jgi:hypothetical protein